MKNLWILTEERPKKDVILMIVNQFGTDRSLTVSQSQSIRILPIIDEKRFTFTYQVQGVDCDAVNQIFIKVISGASSFVDFLIFYQNEPPKISSPPIYAIEETKTTDAESRNTGVYQRCSKFVFIDFYYPSVQKIMLYNQPLKDNKKPTDTNIFGTRMLLTLDVKILGKTLDPKTMKPFESLDELIDFKNSMRPPPANNVPIAIEKFDDKITVSGRLIKGRTLSHDPNIGALSIISRCIRILGWKKDIVITKHGLTQDSFRHDNKFIRIANQIDIKLDGLSVPEASLPEDYWKYEEKKEKLGTIFLHLVVEDFTSGRAIFENHGGCERGYFYTSDNKPLQIKKYQDRAAYKSGDTSKRVSIPDLILFDPDNNEIVNIEGKTFQNILAGIKQLSEYDFIEEAYIQRYYDNPTIHRSVVIYGGSLFEISEPEIGFALNKNGVPILGPNPPKLISLAITNLLQANS